LQDPEPNDTTAGPVPPLPAGVVPVILGLMMPNRVRCAIVTVSDRSSAGEREDASGPAVAEILSRWGWVAEFREILPDDERRIADRLAALSDLGLDLILTTGGTGLGPRDRTPEATVRIGERLVPGVAERIRSVTGQKNPRAYLSRGTAVIRGRSLIVNLPGSPRGAAEALESLADLMPHMIEVLREDPASGSVHEIENHETEDPR
jgi:molybdopterin adenylyltransferase